MKSREEVAAFINNQLYTKWSNPRLGCHHYGVLELRDLMDFIFESDQVTDKESIFSEYQQEVRSRYEKTLQDGL